MEPRYEEGASPRRILFCRDPTIIREGAKKIPVLLPGTFVCIRFASRYALVTARAS